MSVADDAPALSALLQRPDVAKAMALLEADGEEARLVGGAVRDALLGRAAHDVDIATTCLPQMVLARARAAGIKAVPTGVDHGTVTLFPGAAPIEVTTLRSDVATDGRHAQVVFGRDFKTDAARRDFTINAMSVDAAGRLHDEFGGREDLRAGRVRFIGAPDARIAEDALRILRFFRFSARFAEGAFDAAGFAATIRARRALGRLSAERISGEMARILAGPNAGATVSAMAGAGLMAEIMTQIPQPLRFSRARALGLDDLDLLWASLWVTTREDVAALRFRLRLSNAQTRRLEAAAGALEVFYGEGHAPVGARLGGFVLLFGAQAVRDGLALRALDSDEMARGAWLDARAKADAYSSLKLPASGEDFRQRGVPQGRAIGRALKSLQAKWIRAGFPTAPDVIARLIDEAIEETRFIAPVVAPSTPDGSR